MTNRRISIIGFGRFGQVLASLLHEDFQVLICDRLQTKTNLNVQFVELNEALQADTIFICVPIHRFEKVIKSIAATIPAGATVIDTCSVKVHPVQVMQQNLPESINIIATHPLFGPDSIKLSKDLKVVMHKVRSDKQKYLFWKNYFANKNMGVIEITPEEHDRHVANTQGLTHYIGRILQAMDVHSTDVDTLGFQKLLEIEQFTGNDTWELYCDMQKYNPYSKEMMQNFDRAKENVIRNCAELLRKQLGDK